jgi:DNA adenine methylase
MLGDINPELISTYTEVKYRLAGILRILETLPNDRATYLLLRSWSSEGLSPSEKAARFIYLNRYCFNGLYRTNSSGQFNVPYGGVRSGRLPVESAFRECSRTLKAARLVRADFQGTLSRTESGDFVYMDPPFAVRGKRVFNEYAPVSFSIDDLRRLRVWMETLQSKRIRFVVSYADSEEADLLVKGFDYRTVVVRRNIAGFTASRRLASEVLVFNS